MPFTAPRAWQFDHGARYTDGPPPGARICIQVPFRPLSQFECPSPLHASGNSTTGYGTLAAPRLGPGYSQVPSCPLSQFECPSPLHAPGNSTTGPGTLTAPHLGPGYNQTPFTNGVSCPSHSCWPSLAELDWTYLFDFKLWLDRALIRVTVAPARPASQPLAPSCN